MNRVKSIGFRHIVPVLVGLVVLPGCAVTSHSRSTSTITSALSYKIPAAVDVKTIVALLEESSMKVLGKPVTVDEMTVPPLAADAWSPVILQENVTSLVGLGEVVIPSIICPGALASIHTLMPSKAGLRLVASCVVVGGTATRIYLTDATTGATGGSAHTTLSHEDMDASFIARIGKALTERLPGIRSLHAADIPIRRTVYRTHDTKAETTESFKSTEEAARIDSPDMTAHALPAVCFTPKSTGIALRDNTGSDQVIGTLDSELIVQEDDPGRNSFLHVTTREGQRGWVKRGDVRWASCPIA
ncbi:MAG: hypothetical protein Q8L77_15335 [Nitrospirota bacterium]|nr:hypothetical protein [Nitrospirota bacterium]